MGWSFSIIVAIRRKCKFLSSLKTHVRLKQIAGNCLHGLTYKNNTCRATIKSEVKLEKTLTFVLIATKTSWLFPQLKTDIKTYQTKLSRTM